MLLLQGNASQINIVIIFLHWKRVIYTKWQFFYFQNPNFATFEAMLNICCYVGWMLFEEGNKQYYISLDISNASSS